MQTFLPYPDFVKSAQCLDRARLGKQRVEASQLLKTLTGLSDGWLNHPATKMWKGYEAALALYGVRMCEEWIDRGYNDNLLPYFQEELFIYHGRKPLSTLELPPWFGDENLHRSHRANLIRKFSDHYTPLFGELPMEPYFWPRY